MWHARADKLGFRISPFGRYMDSEDADPVATYSHLAQRLSDIGILCARPQLVITWISLCRVSYEIRLRAHDSVSLSN